MLHGRVGIDLWRLPRALHIHVLRRSYRRLAAQFDLLKTSNKRLQETLEQTVRAGVTTELAQMMLSGKRPWTHASLADALNEGLTMRYRAFPQKRAGLLRFYSRALSLLPMPPSAVLEIGVKGSIACSV